MRNVVKVLFQGLIICCLMLSVIGGCRKKTKEVDEVPIEDIGEIELTEDVEIGADQWLDPGELGAENESIYQTVYFDLDRSTIRKEFEPVLEAIADDMIANRSRFVRCTGHCCDRGTNEYNFGLGERRAASVRAYLVALGVDAGRIRTLSKGEEEPAVPNVEGQRQKNRRVEFQLYDQE